MEGIRDEAEELVRVFLLRSFEAFLDIYQIRQPGLHPDASVLTKEILVHLSRIVAPVLDILQPMFLRQRPDRTQHAPSDLLVLETCYQC